MTKYAECIICGYAIAIPDDADAGDYLCPTDLTPLTASAGTYIKRFGIIPDYLEIEDDGFLTLHGDARGSNVIALCCGLWDATHHNPLGIKVLEDPGYISSTLTTAPDANRKIRIYSMGDGIHQKGEEAAAWAAGDTTHDGIMSNITLVTKNASWEQATAWRCVLDISVGDVTGQITIYLPSFKMGTYEVMHFWITNDGATYYGSGGMCNFHNFAAGSSEATENLTGNISAGDTVACPVANTSGFYIGDKARLVDDGNAEWSRITAIAVNTSITVEHLDYDYTTAASAKITKINCTRTPYGKKTLRRGLGRMCYLPPDVPAGMASNINIPGGTDFSSSIMVGCVFAGCIANPLSKSVKLRLQYNVLTPGGDVGIEEWGEFKYLTVTPAATANEIVEVWLPSDTFEVPLSGFDGKRILQLQLARMGDDLEDDYTGCIYLVGAIAGITQKHFDSDVRMD